MLIIVNTESEDGSQISRLYLKPTCGVLECYSEKTRMSRAMTLSMLFSLSSLKSSICAMRKVDSKKETET